jgi:hypothetical protein
VLTPYLVNLTEMPRHARAIGPTCGHTQSPVATSVDSQSTVYGDVTHKRE